MPYSFFLLVVLGFKAPLGRCLWSMLCMQHWPIKVYLGVDTPKMHRLPQHVTRGRMGSHPLLIMTQIAHGLFPFWLGYYFGLQHVKVAFYVWVNHIFTIITCFPFYLGFGFNLNIFVTHVTQLLLFVAFYFIFAPSCVNGYKYNSTHEKKNHTLWNYQIKHSSIASN
jgi:hypothetical protein